MKEPVDHIIRGSLPWRLASDPAVTECGLNASKVKTITREGFFQRRKEYGQQRTAMLTCMTCSNTAERWKTWLDDPRQALGREIEWESGLWGERENHGHRLRDELLAIETLISAHREEFDKLLFDMAARREWLERKKPDEPVRKGKWYRV